MLYGLILAGGIGKRLWPESDSNTPKPFLSRNGKTPLLIETLSRLLQLIPQERIFVSTTNNFASPTASLIDNPKISLITEPVSRNTAPAIALAALTLVRSDPEAVMAILPSDSFIDDADAFRHVLASANNLINEDPTRLVTIGIVPQFPATGYGYIKAIQPLISGESVRRYAETTPLIAELFAEKPDRTTAEKYLCEHGFYWNSGIFVWKASYILDLIAQFIPELEPYTSKTARTNPSAAENLRIAFDSLHSVSIDKGVMEKAPNVLLIPAPFRWSDLGTFEMLSQADTSRIDGNNNSVTGASLFTAEASENIVRITLPQESESFTVAIGGINRFLIVLKGNKLLIVPQGRQDLIQCLADRSESDTVN